MPTYLINRCPFKACKGIWHPRSEIVVSCSICKRRFDYPGREVEPERAEVEFPAYTPMKEWLYEANKIAKQNDSVTLKDILKMVPPQKKGST